MITYLINDLCKFGITSFQSVHNDLLLSFLSIVVVNELPIETYLCRVVPSEMPASYELEALKAQAVCARSYAYRQMESYGYPEYEAHVNDSTDYQKAPASLPPAFSKPGYYFFLLFQRKSDTSAISPVPAATDSLLQSQTQYTKLQDSGKYFFYVSCSLSCFYDNMFSAGPEL